MTSVRLGTAVTLKAIEGRPYLASGEASSKLALHFHDPRRFPR
jgi:hypothetical protein